MSDLLNNPKHWQERAEDARRIAEQMTDMEARKTMFEVAEAYTHLAERALLRIGTDQVSERPPGKDRLVRSAAKLKAMLATMRAPSAITINLESSAASLRSKLRMNDWGAPPRNSQLEPLAEQLK